MSSQVAAVWASATGAAIVVAGAAAVYWTHPDFIWPSPAPVVAAGRAPETPASAAPAPAAPSKSSTTATPAVSAPPTPSKPAALASAAQKPSFDVVSVEPTGETVVAGRAAPDAKVELKDDGKTVAEATASPEGQFVIIPPTLPPGQHSLALSTGAGLLAQTSNAISVAVAAPEPAPKAAAAPPSTPSTAAPPPSATVLASSAEQGSQVAVHSVEASLGGRLVAKGVAAPNTVVRLYLSGAYVGDAKTKADGRWSLTIEHGMTPGAYEMRADEIDPADAKVAARAEAPFNYPAASAAPAPSAAPGAPAPSSADVVLDSIRTHHVETGHTLWGISQKYYGDGSRYQVIYAANSNQIRNPSLIYPGQVFVIPKEDRKP